MSKRVKNLLTNEIHRRLAGVEACVVVDYQRVPANDMVALRRRLRREKVRMLVVPNSLAKRATREGPLAALRPVLEGPSALCWGAGDAVSLARIIAEVAGKDGPLQIRGASVEGRTLGADEVVGLSKLPTRTEMIGGVAARLLAPVGNVMRLVRGPMDRLMGQIKTLSER